MEKVYRLYTYALTETILEATGERLQVTHAASTLSTTTESLVSPVVSTHGSRRVAARGTLVLLDVESNLSASAARSVRLSVALT